MKEGYQAHQDVNYNNMQTQPVSVNPLWCHCCTHSGSTELTNIKAELSTAWMTFERDLCWNKKLDSKTYAGWLVLQKSVWSAMFLSWVI